MIISLDKPQVWLAANWRQAAARSFVRVRFDHTLRFGKKHHAVLQVRVPKKFRIGGGRRAKRNRFIER
jgi:hypothetical protein